MAHLTSLAYLVANAERDKYAIPQINVNNLEWIQAVLQAAETDRAPVIIGVSMGAQAYMGSYRLVRDLVLDLMDRYQITVPVCLHLDHGNRQAVEEAIEAGFNSVMFDGSKLPFAENLQVATEIANRCQAYGLGLEIEVGAIGGYEDGHVKAGEKANPHECQTMAQMVPMDLLAASIGNLHGVYPADWLGLDFALLKEIKASAQKPLVLHGGSGIPANQIQEAIRLGVRKINVNTECQVAFTEALLNYYHTHHDLSDRQTYDPRHALKVGMAAIQQVCHEKFQLFGANQRY